MTRTEVRRWMEQWAEPVSLAPEGAGPDLPTALRSARIVGIASSVRSARELLWATGALLRGLVVEAGFRAVTIEGADAGAERLDRYVRSGDGDPRELLAEGQRFLHVEEALAVVRWLRRWAREHPDDPVAVVHGGPSALRAGSLREVERTLARRDLDWHAATGQRVVHWGGTAHLVVGDPRRVPPGHEHPNAGGLMRREIADGYAVVALTVGGGSAPFSIPSPPPDFTEDAFATLGSGPVLVDLSTAASGPAAVHEWLRRPLRTRMIGPTYHPASDHEARVDAGPLAETVDVFLHVPRVTAAEPLAGSRLAHA